MIDKLFFIVLVLNATGLFRFVAPQLGITIGQVSLGLLVLNVYYLIAKAKYTIPILIRMDIWNWLLVLVLWPLLTTLYAPLVDYREIGLLLYYFTLFLGTSVYALSNGLVAVNRMFFFSLVLTVIGLVLSMVAPQYFEDAALLASARSVEMGRAIGFSLQPNILSINISFLFIGWFSLWKYKKTLFEVMAILAFLISILLTGSRTGMLIAVTIVMLILTCSWKKRIKSKKFVRKICVFIVCLIGGIVVLNSCLSELSGQIGSRRGDLIDRMKTLLSFRLSYDDDGVMQDTSLKERYAAQRVYWKLIKEKPLIGHGLGSEANQLNSGKIHLSSHSTMLSTAMEYGIFFPVFFALLLMFFFFNRYSRRVELCIGTNTITQFVGISLILFVVTGGLLDMRAFFVLLGLIYTLVHHPQKVLMWNKTTRTYERILAKREIRESHRKQNMLYGPGKPSDSKLKSVDRNHDKH